MKEFETDREDIFYARLTKRLIEHVSP